MSLKIVTGGTTGAADGTLVDSGNPIVFTALDTPVDAHIRADDDTYANPSQFVAATTAGPAVGKGDIQVSVDGGSTWHGWSDNPLSLVTGIGLASVDLGDLNFPIKLRQHAASPPGDTSGSFDTDGTLAAATALGDVGSFAATPGAGRVALSWAAVANRTSYKVDRATDSGFTTGVTLGIYTGTGTSFTDTGLAAGTTYYYRIKAIGTYRFKDSANYATANAATFSTGFTSVSVSAASNPIGLVEGPDGNIWATLADGNKIARITPSLGTVDEFAVPSSGTAPVGICVLGGNIWYVNNGTSPGITKVSTFSGTPTQTHYTSGFTAPYSCCAGPDGNLWVTDGQYFRKVNPATGAVTASYDAGSGHDLRMICSDGTALFATDRHSATGSVTRCSTGGTVVSVACTDSGAGPLGICYDSAAGKVMLVSQDLGKIYKITPGVPGTSNQSFDAGYVVNASSQIAHVCVGADGRIYTAGYNTSFKNIYSMASGGGSFTNHSATFTGAGIGWVLGHSNGGVYVAGAGSSAKVGRLVV